MAERPKRVRPSRAKSATTTTTPPPATGATVGNPPPGAGAQGMTADQRAAIEKSTVTPAHLNAEQIDMELKRAEFGSQMRGTGDQPPPVHGRTKPVMDATSSTERVFSEENKPDEKTRTIAQAQLEVPRTVRVRAIRLGYYDDKRRRLGDVFLIRPPFTVKNVDRVPDPDPEIKKIPETIEVDEFSDNWMEKVPGNTPLKTTTAKEDLKRKHDEELAARRTPAKDEGGTGDQDVITAGTQP